VEPRNRDHFQSNSQLRPKGRSRPEAETEPRETQLDHAPGRRNLIERERLAARGAPAVMRAQEHQERERGQTILPVAQ